MLSYVLQETDVGRLFGFTMEANFVSINAMCRLWFFVAQQFLFDTSQENDDICFGMLLLKSL